MLMRLTRAGRMRAGKFLALVYALCVLAPALSFAFADGALAAPCLTDDDHSLGIMHVHNANSVRHVHEDGRVHDHSDRSLAGQHVDVAAAPHSNVTAAIQVPSPPAHDDHKAPGARCCGMVCISALPATPTEFVSPSVPISRCAPETYRSVEGRAPPTLYRPPIS
jgi:hypothetical protein